MPKKPASSNSTFNLPGGPARKLTSLTGFLDSPRWSPDGKKIALLFTENAPRAAGPLEPSTKESGVIEEHIYEQRLTLVDPASGKSNQLSPADTYVYEFDWAPDSTRLAYTAAQGNGDNNWWIAQLYTISASSGEVHPVYKTLMQLANPRFSPDGKEIAFIGGIMSDESSTGGDIYTIPASGGVDPHNLTPGPQGLPEPGCAGCHPAKSSSTKPSMAARPSPHSILPRASPKPSGPATKPCAAAKMRSPPQTTARPSPSIRSSWSLAPEVWAGPAGEWTQRTHANDALKPLWGKTEKLHWRSDEFDVEGWLMYPVNYDPSKKYPDGRFRAWRTGRREEARLARRVRHVIALQPGLFRALPESPRQLRRRVKPSPKPT